MKILLSHASEDRRRAEEIALAREAGGHDVLIDRHDLSGGPRTELSPGPRLDLAWAAGVGLAVLLAGCPGPAGDGAQVAELEELGYFAYTPPEALDAAREAVASMPFPFFDEGSGRFFFADAEDLAEGGVGSFLRQLAPTLERLGVDLGEVADVWNDPHDRYTVRAAGREVLIWGPGEQEEARAIAAVRAFAMVNELLAAAGTEERLYAVGGDNDMLAVLLTPALFAVVSEGTEPYGRPYLPRDEPPWYGMPHAEAG